MFDILDFVLDNKLLSIGIFLWVGLSIAVVVTDYRNKTLGFRIIPKILFLPIGFSFLITVSLFIMPLLYGKNRMGYPAFIIMWIVYLIMSIIFFWNKQIRGNLHLLNKVGNTFMGYDGFNTTSSELGDRIDDNEASLVSCLHCRILAVYDRRKWHCSKKAWRLF